MNQQNTKPSCVRYAASILGDKWTPVLLRELCEGARTFSELSTASGGISPRTLSQRLHFLLEEDIISRDCNIDDKRSNYYCLTVKGLELQEILDKMAEWSSRNNAC
ncbi:MAG: helix-turn-helix domain-containing protein [Patescibacteria group bacterium]